jgi:hypothetical protein
MENLGRNAPCACGSGKKYKRCCGIEMPKRRPKAAVPSVYQPSARNLAGSRRSD